MQYCGQYANPIDNTHSSESHLVKQTEFWTDLIQLYNHIADLPASERLEKIKKELRPESTKSGNEGAFNRAQKKKELKINAKNFDGIISPLDPGMILTDLQVDKIRSLDSAKKPIMMEWRNGGLLFKAEDDLRQDVLGIQIVETLDTSWKSRSAFESKYRYDLYRMNVLVLVVYSCVGHLAQKFIDVTKRKLIIY